MKIIIVGCGKIGRTIISSLVAEGHDLVAIDLNREAVNEVGNIYDVMCLCGNGVDWETLQEAGVDKAELFIAVTGSDEFNML
ncbi:MAG: NAD-binding protein, partial [Clostridia bacterium]|nr:NAD-binding protein [Clostridia bacterium]